MRRLALSLLAIAAFLALAGSASAHPLGNFTVNRSAGLEVAGDRLYLRYALDLAEIPTFQLAGQVRARGYPARLARDLDVTVDGRRLPLSVLERRLVARPGAGGLDTIRLDVLYAASGELTGTTRLGFVDRSFSGRVGWREVTISARDGARVLQASVPEASPSDGLRAYPKDVLRSPPAVSSASAVLELGTSSGAAPTLRRAAAPKHGGGGFEALVARDDLSLGVLLLSLLAAMFWGAAHALTPGHGKAMVAAYLVGTRGTPRHAFLLGGTVTIAHTSGVFALGLVTLVLSQLVVPERLYPWLTLVSGLLVVGVGAAVLRSRIRDRGRPERGHQHENGHAHAHRNPRSRDGHGHQHGELGSKGILGIGIAAGLLPCPSALVVLLSAIALHRIGLGLALIVAFSVGLAATITAIGLVAVLARHAFSRVSFEGPVVRVLPALSAALIVAVGVTITAKALPGVL